MTNMKSANQTDREAIAFEKLSNDLEVFALRMRKIPRKAHRCEVSGEVTAIVDIDHALNIFRKVFPGYTITKTVAYRALCALQDILDERQAA